MLTEPVRPFLLGDRWVDDRGAFDVRDPDDGSLVGRVAAASIEDATSALTYAAAAPPMPRHERAEVLESAARRVTERAEELAGMLAREGIKTIREARREVTRCAATLRLAACEALALSGGEMPFDSLEGHAHRLGGWTRVPLGTIVAITPFNDPLNLVAHKVGPALAAGNRVIVKPHEQTPHCALALARALADAGLPPGWLQVLPSAGADVAACLVRDPRVAMVSFTGGYATGRRIAAAAGVKRLAMELGSNCATIVCADADLDLAVPAILSGAFAAAGQNCVHVQRVLIAREIFERFAADLVRATAQITVGPKRAESTDMGPLVSDRAASRIEDRLDQAVSFGADVLVGGSRRGRLMLPTIVTGVPPSCRLYAEEIFGPVTLLEPFDTLDEAIAYANRAEGALQHAVFTRALDDALSAAARLRAGGVIINDSSDVRHDGMPFGGSGRAGIGREGVRFATAEMTQPKLIAISQAVRGGSSSSA